MECLFTEVSLAGGTLCQFKDVAALLNIAANTLNAWFGHGAEAPGSRPPERHLAGIVRGFNDQGVAVELEWFYQDLLAFKSRLVDVRGRRLKRSPGHDLESSLSTDQWIVADANNIGQGIAALYLHPPPPSNDPNGFLLQVSLSFASWPDEIEGLPLKIGLKYAYLAPTWVGCQPAEWTVLDNVMETGGVVTLRGPRDAGTGFLFGKPLEKTTLATMEYTSGSLPAVTLELRSRKFDLEVVPDDPNRDISAARAKVLQRFLQECQISDDDRRVVWSRAGMKRRS